jgi:hypothetical protein
VAGGMLTIFGILSIISFSVYVMDAIVRKSNIILEEQHKNIGGLEVKFNGSQAYFTGNQTCYEPECEIPSLQESIPLLFNDKFFLITALEGEIS